VRLRRLFFDWSVAGWSSGAIGAVGLAVVGATSRHPFKQVWVSFAVALFFGIWMWLLVSRRFVRRLTADAPDPPSDAAIESRSTAAIRVLAGQAVFAAFVAVCVFVASPPVGIALGAAIWQLGTAFAIRRWERRHGMRLLVHRDRLASLDAARVYAVDRRV
jgi:hypothetical protein